MKSPAFLLIIIYFIFSFVSEGYTHSSPLIRVKIIEGEESIEVDANGPYELRWGERSSSHKTFTFSQRIKATEKGIAVGHQILKDKIYIKPKNENSLIEVNKRRYRGKIIVIKKGLSLEVINELPLEEYLYGVINWEISTSWPLASVEAQVIVARTYALKKRKSPLSEDQEYHISNTARDQIYEGVEAETPEGIKAVNLTWGKILTYKGKLANVYYHACCGGYTASSKDVWGKELPYLKAKPDRFCRKSPHYDWELVIDVEEFRKILKEKGYPVGKVYRIEPISFDEGGRIKKLYIEHRGGKIYLKGTELRKIMGPNCLKSTLFKVKRWANYFIFTGRGWGHGVGMCQWGAKRMAEEGYSVEEILEYYFPGTKIEKAY